MQKQETKPGPSATFSHSFIPACLHNSASINPPSKSILDLDSKNSCRPFASRLPTPRRRDARSELLTFQSTTLELRDAPLTSCLLPTCQTGGFCSLITQTDCKTSPIAHHPRCCCTTPAPFLWRYAPHGRLNLFSLFPRLRAPPRCSRYGAEYRVSPTWKESLASVVLSDTKDNMGPGTVRTLPNTRMDANGATRLEIASWKLRSFLDRPDRRDFSSANLT